MGFFDSFPYSNQHTLNLDWLIKKQRELEEYIKQYTAVNNVAYAGVWDITKQYPQWAVVSNGDKSYMSNKPVPVGIPIDNTEYWLHLADLDPRIAGIIKELADIDKSIVDLKKNTADLDKRVSGITKDLNSVNSSVSIIDNKMDAISRNIAGKRFLIIGDSISDEDIKWNANVSNVWVKHFRPMVEMFGGTVTNMSLSGRGYAVSAGGNSFKSLIASTSFTNYDTIIVFGGVNDFLQGIPLSTYYNPENGSFWDALNSSFENLKNSKKEVYIVSPMPTKSVGSSLYTVTLEMYRVALNSAANTYGFHFINGSRISPFGLNAYYYADGLHPLNAYTHYIAEYIFDKILSNGEPFSGVFEVSQKENLSGNNCTYSIHSYCFGPELVFDIRGKATGQYRIDIPNANLFFGRERRANVTGNSVTKLVTDNNAIGVYGDNVGGEFSITVRGYSNSLAVAIFYRH